MRFMSHATTPIAARDATIRHDYFAAAFYADDGHAALYFRHDAELLLPPAHDYRRHTLCRLCHIFMLHDDAADIAADATPRQ